MNVESIGQPVALIVDEAKKNNNTVLSIEPKKDAVVTYLTELNLTSKKDQKFQQIPNVNVERTILYVTGASGSGKSYYTKNFCDCYKKIFPKREIYLFSSITDDSSIDKIKGLKRVKITPEFLNEDISAKDFENSLVIFDDTDCITDKKTKAKIQAILNSVLETGRHFNTSVVYTSHTACNGNDTKKILNEAHSITIFPTGLGGRSLKYLLDQYLGLDKEQIKRIKKLDSRWVTILKSYPMVVLSEKEAYILNPKE
jgi:hypothetical protein